MENKEKSPLYKEPFKERVIKKLRDSKKNANITRELVKKNIKIQYRNSVIGIFWTVLNPFLNMLVMYFVFGSILGYSKSDPTYALYLLCGNIVFNMMRGATSQSLTSLVYNRGLLTKNKICLQNKHVYCIIIHMFKVPLYTFFCRLRLFIYSSNN